MSEPMLFVEKVKPIFPAMQFTGGHKSALSIIEWLEKYGYSVKWKSGSRDKKDVAEHSNRSERLIINGFYITELAVFVGDWVVSSDDETLYLTILWNNEFEDKYMKLEDDNVGMGTGAQ